MNSRLQFLFKKYFEKTASSEERAELSNLINLASNRGQVMDLFNEAWSKYKGEADIISEEKSAEILQNILGKNEHSAKVISIKKRKWWQYAAAAAVILSVIFIGIYQVNNKNISQPIIVKNSVNEVKPGAFKAKLTLADGSIIRLDSAAIGELVKQGNTAVINKDGQLVYQSEKGNQTIIYNTVATANGETYAMTLSDGTKVWLNSGSSIHFPVAFLGKERRIETTGEVYVQVAHNPAQPFIASSNGMEVLALGTEFNINTYKDEGNINATLVKGLVKVSMGTSTTILKPGQQTKLLLNGKFSEAKQVNTEEVVAWKDGFFHFENANLTTILKHFARWYDVEIIFEGPILDRKFFAIINRNNSLNSVLKMLKDYNIVYRIEGKKLIVKSG